MTPLDTLYRLWPPAFEVQSKPSSTMPYIVTERCACAAPANAHPADVKAANAADPILMDSSSRSSRLLRLNDAANDDCAAAVTRTAIQVRRYARSNQSNRTGAISVFYLRQHTCRCLP